MVFGVHVSLQPPHSSNSLPGNSADGEKGAIIMNAEQIVKNALEKNPEIRLVLEIAERAREVESKEPPRNIGIATEIVAIPTNSQSLVPPATIGQTRTA
jgi:hypothetical protein